MLDFLQNTPPEIIFALILMALLTLRAKVSPRASVFVKAPPEKVFELIFPYDGKEQQWRNALVRNELVDADQQIYRMIYNHKLSNGTEQNSEALFRIHATQPARYLELHREGIAGQSTANELLQIIITTSPEKDGTRLSQTYHWGSRPLLAQLLARADLWGGTYRLKGMAETGKPDENTHDLIFTALLIASALVSVFCFGLMLGWFMAFVLVLALFVHELGHLVAYRMIGQPWGRMVFLPFLGAIAMPRLRFQSQAQAVFSALMGPGFSLPVLGFVVLFSNISMTDPLWVAQIGIIVSILNLFNLLPAEPLDGGVAARFLMRKFLGNRAHLGMLLLSAMIILLGLYWQQILLTVFGGLSFLVNLKSKPGDAHLPPLTITQWLLLLGAYIAMIFAYIIILASIISFITT